MYRAWARSELLGKFHGNVCLKISKRTKKKQLEEKCPIFLRPCEEMPHRPKTGVLILHPGEPTRKDEVKSFLSRVEKDKTYKYAMQSIRGPDGCVLPCKDVIEKYDKIGGYSPLLKWAAKLAYGVEKRLDKDSRNFAPHKSIIAFRYCQPMVSKALKEFEIDSIKHLVCYSLEPHYYCNKTAPVYDAIYKYFCKRKLASWSWTVIDRWPLTYMLSGVFAQTIQYELDLLPPHKRRCALLVFVGNGLYIRDVCKGDLYAYQVGTTVHNIMRVMDYSNRYTLCWLHAERCSKKIVRPTLEDTIQRAYDDGVREFVLVPVSYSCECLDTLYELDIAHVLKYRQQWGCEVTVLRSTCPNDHVFMISAMAHVVHSTLKKEHRVSEEFLNECHGCRKKCCKLYRAFFRKFR